jgi:pimeloyl-ACP methyl ester carboxylesterase
MSMIFVHGSGACGDIWRYQTGYFGDSHAVNLPGHPDGQTLKSVDECVDWLTQYINERGCKDVVLAGHSFGGAIVLMYAIKHPQELKGIVILGSGARLRVHSIFLTTCEQAIAGHPHKWQEMIEEWYRRTPADYRMIIIERQKAVGPAVMLNDFLACDKFDIMDRVHEIKLPALIICGESDFMTPVKYANYLGTKIADSRVLIIPGAGHSVFAEKPEVVNSAIEGFVNAISA